jgi:hypothetical protein
LSDEPAFSWWETPLSLLSIRDIGSGPISMES